MIEWPSWIGTPSQVGLLLVVIGSVIIAYIKVWPVLLQARIGERQAERNAQNDRIRQLVQDVRDCQENCDAQEVRLKAEIDVLKNRINNEALQRVQSEISLVATLVQIVDAPQLRTILAALERRRGTFPPEILEGAKENGIERT